MSTLRDLPLFPLGTVLFPKQLLPLHIFEERYKLMIGECLRDNTSFGVVLIKAGREVGGSAVPFDVGTTARILEMQPLALGRMSLKTIGERPFRIVEITQQRPSLRAQVELLDYEVGQADQLGSLMLTVRGRFLAHLDILASLAQRQRPPLDLELDPEALSFFVAATMAMEMLEKQELLELSRTVERLQREASILARENRALQTFLYLREQSKKDPPDQGQLPKGVSLN